jgi:tetratricopeptide (TPR) repeat protein
LKITQNFGSKENSLLEMLKQITDQFIDDPAMKQSSRLRFKLYSLVSQLLLQRKDYHSLEVYLLQTWKSFSEEKLFTKNTHDTKLQMLTYIVNTLFKNSKVKESLAYAEQLHDAMEEYNHALFDKYEIFYYNALVNNYSTFDIPEAIRLLHEMQKLENVKKLPFYELFIYLNLATSYFDVNNYNQAIKNLNKTYLMSSYAKADVALKFKIAVAELIIRYELKDYDFWKYRFDQIYREFKTEIEKGEYELELSLLQLIAKSTELPNGIANKSMRTEADELLALLVKHTDEDEVIRYSRWLNDKINVK